MNNNEAFTEEAVRFICAEVSTALDYLRTKNIVHRDVKPDNILLDDLGHAHLTDFNVATYLKKGDNLRNLAGTMPYIAPEIFEAVASSSASGYGHAADWWSLGVTAYELMCAGRRPFDIGSRTSVLAAAAMFAAVEVEKIVPLKWSPEFSKFVAGLLTIKADKRLVTWSGVKKTKLMSNMKYNRLIAKKLPPPFVPKQNGLNCDPTYELEEMIVEAKPLHKKKKRLLRQQSLLSNSASSTNSFYESEVLIYSILLYRGNIF